MKKNRLMRFAAVLLVLTLMTSCFVGGTFAKYVTTDSATDTARVAKWGIEVLASGNLFGEDYNPNSTADSVDDDVIGTVTTSVSSSDTANIVAPGTKNIEGFKVSITGTPEVSYNVTAATGNGIDGKPVNEDIFLGEGTWGVMVLATGLNNASNVNGYYTKVDDVYTLVDTNDWVSGTDYYELHDQATVAAGGYYPINWAVAETGAATGGNAIADGKNLVTIAEAIVANLVNGKLDDVTTDYGKANTNAAASYTLTWEWPFSTGNDAADTILGNLRANAAGDTDGIVVKLTTTPDQYTSTLTDGIDYNLDIVFNFAVTVEQTN